MYLRITAAIILGFASTTAVAQSASATDTELTAEHRVWTEEHQHWTADHAQLAKRLRAVAGAIERDDGLKDHGSELEAHRALLTRGDNAERALAHARLRAEHEEAREAHHELIDSVRDVEAHAREDETTRSAEAPPRR